MTGSSGEALRTVMRRLPAPVTVVTTASGTQRRGITIGSFTSTSIEPALVSFNVSRESPMLDLLAQSGHFVVHFLSEHQRALSDKFAVPNLTGDEQFEGVTFSVATDGLPLLTDVIARLRCSVQAMHDAGDHMIIIGLVHDTTELSSDLPLLYYDRRYVSLDSGGASGGRSSDGTVTS
jgi:flavin reductase (DIM6/NTAB) family NADH-FMN oxidoreductase RutF